MVCLVGLEPTVKPEPKPGASAVSPQTQMEPPTGFEPVTHCLQNSSSTAELGWQKDEHIVRCAHQASFSVHGHPKQLREPSRSDS